MQRQTNFTPLSNDKKFESSLRPKDFSDFFGHTNLKERLAVFLKAALERGESPGHCLFFGPPGLGKTSLAYIVADTVAKRLVTTSGPQFEKPADLIGILTNLQEGDVFFIDEIHRMGRSAEEYLYSAMEDYKIDLMLDSGPNARSVRVDLPMFTLIGATTRPGSISSPLRSRFMFSCRLDFYDVEDLKLILSRSAELLKISMNEEACVSIASRSRGTPRIANNLLRWVRDFAQIQKKEIINRNVAEKALTMLSIDDWGLDVTDLKILRIIIDYYQGGPVGLKTLAIAVGEETQTIEDVYEPFLILKGLIKRTSRGRVVTELAYSRFPKK